MNVTRLAAVVVAVLGVPALVRAGGRAVVREGRSDWTIVTEAREPGDVLAAEEIAKYLERMTGVRLPVAREATPGRPGIVIRRHAGEEPYRVTASGVDGISVAGRTPGDTLNAAYRLLDHLGCRFLAPELAHYEGTAEVVPRRATVEVPEDLVLTGRPAMKFRKLYVEEGISHNAENLRQMVEWMPKVGYNTLVVPTDYQGRGRVKWDNWREPLTPELQRRGIIIEVGGHGYQNFLNAGMEDGALFKRHPEWFAQDAKGVRQKSKAWVPCTSNAEAVRALTDNFIAYVKERPEIQIFDFWPPDGAKWCECEECKALGTPSDRQAILLAHVKGAVKAVRPELRLEVIAYSSYLNPPENQTVDPSVLVDFCPISQQFDHQIDDPTAGTNAKYAEALRAWRKQFAGDISVYTYYRKYAWDSLPAVIPHYMQRDIAWYMTLPVQGISTYAEPGDWFTYELNHYVLAALAWEPGADVDALVRKFAEARYGSAADVAVEAYGTLEEVVRKYTTLPHSTRQTPPELAEAQGRLERMRDRVRRAREAASGDGVSYNLGRMGLIFDYAIEDIAIQRLMAGNDPAARERAVALHHWVESHADDGTFLISGHRLNQARMLRRLGFPSTAPAVPE